MSRAPAITVVMVTCNDRHNLPACFDSLRAQTYWDFEVVVSDNGSTDGSAEFAEQYYPSCRVIRNGRNLGYAGGNNAGIRAGQGSWFLLMNNDAELAPTCLAALMDATSRYPDAGIPTPRILLYADRERLNCMGNRVHFTGMTFCEHFGERVSDWPADTEPVSGSGAALLISREWLTALGGGFDEDFADLFTGTTWMSLEDTDLALRTWMLGRRVICVADAHYYHKHTIKMDGKKLFYLECGRYLLAAKNFPDRALRQFLPGFLLMEAIVLGFCLGRGLAFLRAKIRTYGWLWRYRARRRQKRREFQAFREQARLEVQQKLCSHVSVRELGHAGGVPGLLSGMVNRIFAGMFRRALRRLNLAGAPAGTCVSGGCA